MNEIRAWKEPRYRRVLGDQAPDHPAGIAGMEPLLEADLAEVNGAGTAKLTTHGCCRANLTITTACGVVCLITYFLC